MSSRDQDLSVQLYSVREPLADDLFGTLARLSEIGFSQVEPFDLLTDPAAPASRAGQQWVGRADRPRLAGGPARTTWNAPWTRR